MTSINKKTSEEIKIMAEGGKKLAKIKKEIKEKIDVGVSAWEIEKLATALIKKAGAKPSFKMVPNYLWSTCVNVDKGVVHGIPKKEVVFKNGDLVSVDMGLFYKGFHTDSSFSVVVGKDEKKEKLLLSGEKALDLAIRKARVGNRVFDMSKAIQESLKKDGLTPITALVGHGIGKKLHEEPRIPCFVKGKREDSPIIPEGAALAIEVMYTNGGNEILLEDDGWTISTKDGSLAGLFEETVVVTKKGPLVLTRG